MHKKIITGALLVFFVTSMFSSQSAFAGGVGTFCASSGDCSGDGNVCTTATCVGAIPEVCIPEVCLPLLPCTPEVCTPATPGVCFNNVNFNSCNDGLECTTNDTCLASLCGGIPKAEGASCGDAGSQCTNQDTCSLLGQCIDNGQQPNGDPCGSSSNTECSNADTCFSGQCNPNNESGGITCGDAGTACINQDTCDGSGACSDNGFASDSTSCDADGDQCTGPDACDGSGVCLVGPVITGTEACFPIGGQIIPIESTSLILAGTQTFSWMIPVVLSVVGIGLLAVTRKSE